MVEKKVVLRNLLVAMLAQGISLVLSFLISFIVPKMLDVEAFSFWQLFIFYITYVGFFHLGLNDGVYLKYGGLDLNEMDKNLVSGQFKCLFFMQIAVITVALPFICFMDMETERQFVWIFVLVYMLIYNLSNYLAYIFQAANLTKWYSYSVILDKLFFMAAVIFLLTIKNRKFEDYIFFYICGKLLCLTYCIVKGYSLILGKCTNRKVILAEVKDSVSVGIKLTLSAMASMLILGVGRFVIDSHWGILVFGKISFALSLTTFILAFIQQVSMVFFPILRRVNEKKQNQIYQLMREFCFFVMPLVYVVMIPGKMCIEAWLPKYTESVYYLGILLPICIFDSKMNMIFNTFFKALRKEKELLKVNIISFCLSCVLSIIGAYIFDSYWFVIIAMVISIMFRSVVSEQKISHVFESDSLWQIVYELIFAAINMIVSILDVNPLVSLLVFVATYVMQVLIYKKIFSEFVYRIRHIAKIDISSGYRNRK